MTNGDWRAGAPLSSARTLGRSVFARRPAGARPIVANAAQFKLALHPAQLRIGDRLDHVFQIAVDAPEGGLRMDANALSLRPAKPVAPRRAASIRHIIIALYQAA